VNQTYEKKIKVSPDDLQQDKGSWFPSEILPSSDITIIPL